MAKRMIDTELWNNEDIIENFTADDKYFWLYLLTNPHNNICGIMKSSSTLIARDMSFTKDKILKLLERFEQIHNLIRIDKETNELMILNWWKFNWSKSEKLITSINETLKSIRSEKIISLLQERIEAVRYGIDRVSIGYAYPSNTNTNYNIDTTALDIIEKDIDKREIKNKEKRDFTEDIKNMFETLWQMYPRKVSKGNALKSFEKQFKGCKDIETIKSRGNTIYKALVQYKASVSETEKEYIKHFASWINGELWEWNK